MTQCSCHIVKKKFPQNFLNFFFLIVYVIYAQTWHRRNGTIVNALQNTKQNMKQEQDEKEKIVTHLTTKTMLSQ